MEMVSEIDDKIFGRLSLVDESVYFADVPWNRGQNIRLFIHVDGKNPLKCIESAKKTFSLVRQNEMKLFSQGIEHLYSSGVISDSDKYEESFLQDDGASEISIEINVNGEGRIVYLVMMLGSIIIAFSHDSSFQEAEALAG